MCKPVGSIIDKYLLGNTEKSIKMSKCTVFSNYESTFHLHEA